MQQILKAIKTLKPKTILELGSGKGKLSSELAKKYKVICIDINQKINDGVKTIKADLNTYNIKNNYDLIIGMGILHLIKKDILKQIKSKAKYIIFDTLLERTDCTYYKRNEFKEIFKDWKIIEYEEYKEKKDLVCWIVAKKSKNYI